MHIAKIVTFCLLIFLSLPQVTVKAETSPAELERAVSETLDVWRDGCYEQLYERLAHRGKTSREAFVRKMRDAGVRPACCFQKMENFKVLNEKRATATVYARIGLESVPSAAESCTREFKLTNEEGIWKMQLSDIYSMAGATGKKKKRHHR